MKSSRADSGIRTAEPILTDCIWPLRSSLNSVDLLMAARSQAWGYFKSLTEHLRFLCWPVCSPAPRRARCSLKYTSNVRAHHDSGSSLAKDALNLVVF